MFIKLPPCSINFPLPHVLNQNYSHIPIKKKSLTYLKYFF